MNYRKENPIEVVITGSTIDCENIDPKSKVYSFGETMIPKMLAQAGIHFPISHTVLMRKDSLHMTEDDRKTILAHCLKCDSDRIVITHGTDTMAETARTIGSSINNKVIVLTGSMIPFNQPESDALFNLGTALISVQLLPPGTYVSMNGMIFPFDNVRKNVDLGRFETIR